MEKKKKRLLIIIVSILLSVLLIVGGVLGIVFGMRNNGGSNPPPQNPEINNPPSPPEDNPPSPPVDESAEILKNQRDFIGKLNSLTKSGYVQSVENLDVVDAEGNKITKFATLISIFNRGYIAYSGRPAVKELFVYRYDGSGKKYAVGLKQLFETELYDNGQSVLNGLVDSTINYYNGFASYMYSNATTNLDVVYVDENGGMKIVNRISATYENGKYKYKGHEYDDFNIKFNEAYYQVDFYSNVEPETRKISMSEIYAYDSAAGETKNCYTVQEESMNDMLYLAPQGLVIEKHEINSAEQASNENVESYSYKLFNFSTGELLDFNIDEGVLKVEFGKVSGTDYFYKFVHSSGENGTISESGVMSYLDASGKVILSYDAKGLDDLILAADDTHILTKSGILLLSGQINLEYQSKFDNFTINGITQKLELDVDKILQNVYVVTNDEGKNYVLDLSGTVVGEEYEFAYRCGETVILAKNSSYFIYDLASKEMKALPQGVDVRYVDLLNKGIYLINVNNNFTIYDYTGKVLADNIYAINFTATSDGLPDAERITIMVAYSSTDMALDCEFWFRGSISETTIFAEN